MNIELIDGIRKGIVLACVWGGMIGLCIACVKHITDFAILFSTITICGMVGVVGEYVVSCLRGRE